jgi:RimJ/RimL family protein N-acetyltransferase
MPISDPGIRSAPITRESTMRLETERLIIRSWSEADIDRYAEMVGKASVMRYIGDGQTQDRDAARTFIAGEMEGERQERPIFWAVESKATNELIGFCGFGRSHDEADMGWRYDDRYWGMGYGYEAAAAVLAYAVERFGFARIISRADPDNLGSIKIMKKLGFTFEKEVTNGVIRRVVYAYSRTAPSP